MADCFAGKLHTAHGGATPDLVLRAPVSGVAFSRDGQLFYTSSRPTARGEEPSVRDIQVRRLSSDGSTHLVALPLAHERAENPDGVNSYGFTGLSRACEQRVPRDARPHHGGVESDPYKVRVLVTRRLARQQDLPGCTVGEHYRSDPMTVETFDGSRIRHHHRVRRPGQPDAGRSAAAVHAPAAPLRSRGRETGAVPKAAGGRPGLSVGAGRMCS